MILLATSEMVLFIPAMFFIADSELYARGLHTHQ